MVFISLLQIFNIKLAILGFGLRSLRKKIKLIILVKIAWILSALNNKRLATKFWLKALKIDSKNPVYLTTTGQFLWQISKKKFSQVLIKKALDCNPNYGPALFNLGFLKQENKDHDKAIIFFTRAILINKKNDLSYYGRGISYFATKQYKAASDDFNSTIKLQPMSPYAYYQLAHVQFAMGRTRESQKTIETVNSFEPQVAEKLKKELKL